MTKKILFIMFQGSGTNLKAWNEYTKSKFLDRLKIIGEVYTYQDKTHNIWHYDKSNIEYKDYDMDIDINLAYVKPDTHIMMVYDDIKNNLRINKKNVDEYKFIPIGFSAGGYLALYFAQVYASQCIHVILLDSSLFTPNNMKARLKMLEDGINKSDKSISNAKYKKMLENWKTNNTDIEDAYKISYLNNYIRTLFISQHLKLELPVPTLAFVNIMKPEGDEWSKDFNNKRRLEEVKILKKHNKTSHNYKAIIFTNKTHYIFDKIQPAKAIIKEINNLIKN
jgi:hypothetical protein